ncbi:hypothetical protein CFC21_004231 [Triticum aestivum]|uniref:Uncharacterized protein n=1 Tax=Triticum aestivum TaxID=4565 RepID=A0A3B5Y6K4_WHEAT|nr:hypothetical protein CFC21_004229 [Triticum aestivum]KAF6986484.1 hypothetical protein CFC21_004231 [Triticum aestivum]
MLAATAACRAPARPLPAARPGSSYLLGSVLLPKRRAPAARRRGRSAVVRCGLLPVDPWAPGVDSQSIASQLFAVSLFPYLGFLYFMTRSKTAPGLTLFGFYFLLARRRHHQSSLRDLAFKCGFAAWDGGIASHPYQSIHCAWAEGSLEEPGQSRGEQS